MAFIVGFCFGASIVGVYAAPGDLQNQITDIDRRITANAQSLLDVQRDVEVLKDWRNHEIVDTDLVINAKVLVLEKTIDEHEKLLWILVAGVLMLIIKTIGEAVSHSQAAKKHEREQEQERERERQEIRERERRRRFEEWRGGGGGDSGSGS